MASIFVIQDEKLPPPATGFDLTIWPTRQRASVTQIRTWAGWSESYVLAGAIDHLMAFRPDLEEWPGSSLAVGNGKIWRFEDRYIAWLEADAYNIPEVPRALALAGVELMIAHTALGPSPFLNPLWRAVQATQVYGLALGSEPQLFLPCELDPREEGVVPLQDTPGGLLADVDFAWLEDARRLFPIHRGLRPKLYKMNRWWPS